MSDPVQEGVDESLEPKTSILSSNGWVGDHHKAMMLIGPGDDLKEQGDPTQEKGIVFFLFVLRQRSLHTMEGQLRQSCRRGRLIGRMKPSSDRMGQMLSLMDLNQLRPCFRGSTIK